MALSKEEQSVLDDIEKGLREDPVFAAGLDVGRVRQLRRRRAAALALPGLVLLLLGEMLALTAVAAGVVLSICGFVAMLLAVALAFSSSGLRRPQRRPSRRRLPHDGRGHS